MSSKNSFNQKRKSVFVNLRNHTDLSCPALQPLKQRTYLFLISNPFFFQKLNRSYGSYSLRQQPFLLAPRRWGRFARQNWSATQRQKFHTDDVKSVWNLAMDPTSQEPRSKIFNGENTVGRPELQSLSKKNDLLSFRCSPFHCLHDCIGKDHFRYNKIHC